MRLREREAFYRQQDHVVTINDVQRALKAADLAAEKAEERRKRAAKEATKGQALPGIEVGL